MPNCESPGICRYWVCAGAHEAQRAGQVTNAGTELIAADAKEKVHIASATERITASTIEVLIVWVAETEDLHLKDVSCICKHLGGHFIKSVNGYPDIELICMTGQLPVIKEQRTHPLMQSPRSFLTPVSKS